MPNYKEQTNYNEIVGVSKDGELVVLEYTFAYEDGELKGATGHTMGTLTEQMIEAQSETDQIKDYWQEAVSAGDTEDSLADWAEKVQSSLGEGEYYFMDDPSFRDETDEAYNRLTEDQKSQLDQVFGKKGEDFVDYDVRACGRCLPTKAEDYTLLLRPDLLQTIADHESK